MLIRLINNKVDNNKTDGHRVMFDGSLRESVIKFGYPINDEILENGIGLTVKGRVSGYVKGKALVRIEGSKFTGIISTKDI